MPFQPVDKCIHGVVEGSLDGQLIQNSFWFEYPLPFAEAMLDVAIGLMQDWWYEMRTEISNEYSVSLYKATDEFIEAGLGHQMAETAQPLGNRTISSLPGNCAVCVSLKSGYTNRSANGRSYLAGIPIDKVDAGLIDTAFRNAADLAYTHLIDAAFAANLPYVVVSRWHNHVKRGTAVSTPVASIVVDRYLDSQRRRLPGRGA